MFTRVFVKFLALTMVLEFPDHGSRIMTFGYAWCGSCLVARRRRARGSWLLARRGSIMYVVSVYVLPEIGIPRLKTDSEVAVTALSEGFSPLAVLTLRLESLPYQRAVARHSRFPVFCVTRLTTRLNPDSEFAVTALSEGF